MSLGSDICVALKRIQSCAVCVTLVTLLNWPETFAAVTAPQWLSLLYVSVFSMLVGFVFWYRGLALGGIAGVSQLQLLQPFLGLGLAAMLLGEPIAPSMVAVTLLVVLSVFGAKRFAR